MQEDGGRYSDTLINTQQQNRVSRSGWVLVMSVVMQVF